VRLGEAAERHWPVLIYCGALRNETREVRRVDNLATDNLNNVLHSYYDRRKLTVS